MKIAIASDVYYPMTNGIAVFTHNLAVGLAKRGHEVLVVCPSFKGKKYTATVEGVKTAHLASMRIPFYPDQINKVPEKKKMGSMSMPRIVYRHGIWISPYPYPEVKKILDEFQPDVIHLQTAETIALAIRSYAKKRKIPLVTTGHAYPDNLTQQVKLIKPVKRPIDEVIRRYRASFLKHSEYATAPTELAIEGLVRKERKKIRVEALSNGVDLSSFKPGKISKELLDKYNIDMNRPRVLYVGRVDPEKSISVVMNAFSKALKEVPEAEFMIIGDGIDKSHLEKLSIELGIQNSVKFLGRILPPTLNELYRAGWLFATASETETQGIVLIEAAATGLPLIAVNGGAVGEVCHTDENGHLCEPKDVDTMADAMVKILKDEELRKKYSAASLELAKKHDINHTLERFEEIYQIAMITKEDEK